MAIQGIGAASFRGISGSGPSQKSGPPQFSKTFKASTQGPPVAQPRGERAVLKVQTSQRADAKTRAAAGQSRVHGAGALQVSQPLKALEPTQMIDQVAAAQKRMESVLQLAQSGKSFTPGELLSLQSQMYRASQELDLAGKVIEKATGGVKQILQTQI